MTVSYYGVKTKSGSWYLLSSKKHTFRKTEWSIHMKGKTFLVVALIDAGLKTDIGKPSKIAEAFHEGLVVSGQKIGHIKQFVDRCIFFGNEMVDHSVFIDPGAIRKHMVGNTSPVADFITFK